MTSRSVLLGLASYTRHAAQQQCWYSVPAAKQSPIELVKQLRAQTGAPIGDIKKALEKTDNNVQAAIDALRTMGVAAAAKKATRSATEVRSHVLYNVPALSRLSYRGPPCVLTGLHESLLHQCVRTILSFSAASQLRPTAALIFGAYHCSPLTAACSPLIATALFRSCAQGLVGLATANGAAALVELNCETDFVARSDQFMRLPRAIAAQALQCAPRGGAPGAAGAVEVPLDTLNGAALESGGTVCSPLTFSMVLCTVAMFAKVSMR